MSRRYDLIIAGLGLCGVFGCASGGTRVEITTFDENGNGQLHYADFKRVSYRMSPAGLLEVVMRTERPSTVDPTQTIAQILYIKTFWNPRPGTTFVEATQIDAQAEYAMLTPPTGVRYDGSAFLTWHLDKSSGILKGKIESGTLAPRYRMGDAVEPFGPARISGTVHAVENPREVVNAVQMLETQFSKQGSGVRE